jgi:NhaP-type Na+/H+ or K+/H+ antiporter
MQTPVIIVVIGAFIFWGHYLARIFERRGIPDVLGLMAIGILIGPVTGWVDPKTFGIGGSLFSNLVLIFILFESGTDLRISEVKSSFRHAARITFFGFLATWIILATATYFLFDLTILSSLFIGAAMGGTSSAVVVGLVRKIAVKARTSTTLIMESVESDVFTLAIPLAILSLMVTGNIEINKVVSQFIASIVISVMIGIGGAFLWSFIINRFPMLKTTKFTTPAFLLILYGISELLQFSGPLTALSYGIAIGNLQYLEPRFLERFVPNQAIILMNEEKTFFSELVFLLRTFFFVFIGISIQIDRFDWMMLGALLTLFVVLARLFIVPAAIPKDTPVFDKAIISTMVAKGLGAAVIATLPFQQKAPEGEIIQAICFSIILFSTVYCAILFYFVHKGYTLPFYRLVYGKDKTTEEG